MNSWTAHVSRISLSIGVLWEVYFISFNRPIAEHMHTCACTRTRTRTHTKKQNSFPVSSSASTTRKEETGSLLAAGSKRSFTDPSRSSCHPDPRRQSQESRRKGSKWVVRNRVARLSSECAWAGSAPQLTPTHVALSLPLAVLILLPHLPELDPNLSHLLSIACGNSWAPSLVLGLLYCDLFSMVPISCSRTLTLRI